MVRFGSVCSGIEAASVAWHPLGWQAAWLAEIEPFPSAVLAHHYPDVPNLGDMTALPSRILAGDVEAPDLFCGGTPCQAFSVAGLRRSLDDARGNLSLTFCEIANAIDDVRRARGDDECIVFWENVPGVLSTQDNAFGCFLSALAGCDTTIDPLAATGWTNAGVVAGPQRTVAWRVLDAQYFGVAQRRRRVFVVASARDGFDPAAVLFEFDGLRRDTAPSREAGQSIAPAVTAGAPNGGAAHGARSGSAKEGLIVPITMAHGQGGAEIGFDRGPTEVQCVAHSLRGEGFDASEDGTGRGTPLVPVAFHPTQDPISSADVCHAIGTGSRQGCATAAVFVQDDTTPKVGDDLANCLRRDAGGEGACVLPPVSMQVRRLTPVECERLQGFPDNYTAIPWRKKPASDCPDGPRYKALGNGWAVPVVRWIGSRINAMLEHQ